MVAVDAVGRGVTGAIVGGGVPGAGGSAAERCQVEAARCRRRRGGPVRSCGRLREGREELFVSDGRPHLFRVFQQPFGAVQNWRGGAGVQLGQLL